MSSLQNSSPHPYPYTNSNLNPSQNPNAAPSSESKSLTFDEVSKFFSFPLSDAAESFGVCTSVLKKICHENGLVRWPYRKYLNGKSIEEIKEDAAKEKNKFLNELPKAPGQMNDASASSTIPSFAAPQLQNRTTSSVPELSKSRNLVQQPGKKSVQTGSPQKLHGSTLAKGSPADLDEFKYGFPPDGLATVSYRWWRNSSSNGSKGSHGKNDEERNKQAHINSMESGTLSSTIDGENCQKKTEESSIDSSETDLLSALRKRAVKEGRDALKLGVHRGCGINKLDRTRKMVLLQIFKASLPSEWRDGSF